MESSIAVEQKKPHTPKDPFPTQSKEVEICNVECKILPEEKYCVALSRNEKKPVYRQIVPIQCREHTIVHWDSSVFIKKNEITEQYDNIEKYPASSDIIQPDECVSIDLIERSQLDSLCKKRIYQCFSQSLKKIKKDHLWTPTSLSVYLATGIFTDNFQQSTDVYCHFKQEDFHHKNLQPGDIILILPKCFEEEEKAYYFIGENYVFCKNSSKNMQTIAINSLDSLFPTLHDHNTLLSMIIKTSDKTKMEKFKIELPTCVTKLKKIKKCDVKCKILPEEKYCVALSGREKKPFYRYIVPIQCQEHTIVCWNSSEFIKKNEITGQYDNIDDIEKYPASYDCIEYGCSIDLIQRSQLPFLYKCNIYYVFANPLEQIDKNIFWDAHRFVIYLTTCQCVDNFEDICYFYDYFKRVEFNDKSLEDKSLESGDIILTVDMFEKKSKRSHYHHARLFLGENYFLHIQSNSIMITTLDSEFNDTQPLPLNHFILKTSKIQDTQRMKDYIIYKI